MGLEDYTANEMIKVINEESRRDDVIVIRDKDGSGSLAYEYRQLCVEIARARLENDRAREAAARMRKARLVKANKECFVIAKRFEHLQ